MANWLSQCKRLGRTHEKNGRLWLAFSGSGIAFQVTGTRCALHLVGDSTAVSPGPDTHTARYALYVGGRCVQTGMMNTPEIEVEAFRGTEMRTATVTLLKLSESAMSTLAVADVETDGTLVPVPDRAHLVEFVGDSITCGYGVDTADETCHFHTCNEDVTKAYAWQAADILDIDRSMVCLSGYGVLSGYTSDPETPSADQLLPPYYEKVGFSYAESDGEHAQDWPWPFGDDREPEVVVVNLGTNDASYAVDNAAKRALFIEKYKAFLRQIRRCNPNAHILCMLGVMGDSLYPSVERAAAEYTAEAGDHAVETMRLEAIRPETEGYAADFHPSVQTHTRIARVVADRLSAMLGL